VSDVIYVIDKIFFSK